MRITIRAWVQRLTGVILLGLTVCVASGQAPQPGKARPGGPTLEEIYSGKRPDFLDEKRLKNNQPLKLSRQPWFFNMADLEHDYRVDALLKKGDELFAAKDYRGAIKLYQEVIANFPNDLWRIQVDGVFVPSALYAQRQLLRMPNEKILYYRTLHDAEARPLFEKAKKYFSPLDLAEVAERYTATSYGPLALWELGNMALDQRDHAKALFYYRQIRDYCPVHNIPEGQLSLRLAACYKYLGMEKEYAAARAEAAGDKEATTGPFLRTLDQVKVEPAPYFRQVRNSDCVSMGDYDLFPDLTQPVDRTEFVWSESNPRPQREWYVRALPWVCGNYVCYLHHNVLYCRSLLSGKLNWAFGPGGTIDWFDRAITGYADGCHASPVYHPESDLLVHDGLVFASIVKEGPSLVAVDQITGQLRWARGAIAATGDAARATRYLTPPAPGPNVVYAPYVFDDVAGQSHLSSRTGIQCLDSRTGRLIWSRDDALLTPPQFNISSAVRRIRVYGTQPTVRDGVVYHCTNAGIVAALDALSGRVLWCTRYPHGEDVHDLLKDANQFHTLWFSRPPLLRDGRLYVTPVDSEHLICLEAATGKVLWSQDRANNQGIPYAHTLVGVNAAGELVLDGRGLIGLDPATGKKLWSRSPNPADTTAPIANAVQNRCRAVMTRTNKIYFNANTYGGTHTEQYWDMGAKKTVAERWYYDTGHTRTLTSHNEQVAIAAQKAGREPTPEEFVSNNTELFTTYHRMAFERYGTVFELEVSPQAISLWYDKEKVAAAVAKDDSPQGLFRGAELKEMDGDRKAAIVLFEKALSGIPAFPTPFRTEINRQLFRLYNRQAESAVRAGDLVAAERFCEQMALACTTSDDEIHTILALAEIAEKQGRWADAAAALTGAIKHHGGVKIGLPAVLAGDTAALRARGLAVLANLEGKSPRHYYAKEFDLAVKTAEGTLDNYFSILSPLAPEMQVQTGEFAGRWLQRLLAKAPEDFRRQYEAAAEALLRGETDEETLRLLGEYPGTAASQKALDRLIEQAAKLPEPSRRIALWRLNDAGRSNGLKVPAGVQQACNIRVAEVPPVPLAASYNTSAVALDHDVNTLALLLQPGDGAAAKVELAFLGLRSKRINANKFGLVCWDVAANKKRWEAGEIRLKDKGEEEGFTKFFLHNGKVIVHGWYNVLAFDVADGKPRWRFQVPYGFRVLDSAVAEDVLVLTDSTRTIAVHLANGQLIWEANETGGVYSPPYLRDNLLVTVRRNPAGVAFRDLGTGRLLTLLPMPGLCETTRNPAVEWDEPGVPIAATRDTLLLTDGWDYVAVDLPGRTIRWQKRITNLDRGFARGGTESGAFRFWANDSALVVLKSSYDSIALEAVGLADGALRWQINEVKTPGVVHSLALNGDTLVGVYHPKEESSALHVLGYRPDDGKSAFKQVQRGFDKPQTWLQGPVRGGRLVVQMSDEQKRSLLVVEVSDGKLLQKVEVKGFGRWGQYGQVSYAVQGAYLVVLSDKELTVARPR